MERLWVKEQVVSSISSSHTGAGSRFPKTAPSVAADLSELEKKVSRPDVRQVWEKWGEMGSDSINCGFLGASFGQRMAAALVNE